MRHKSSTNPTYKCRVCQEKSDNFFCRCLQKVRLVLFDAKLNSLSNDIGLVLGHPCAQQKKSRKHLKNQKRVEKRGLRIF